jgi:nucleotide-binding universal stress UspA family protein
LECLLRANSGHWAGARLAVKFCSRNCTSGRISKAIAQAYTRRQHVHKIERLNILIPTDGSELAEHGVTNGLSLAKSVGARVTAIIIEEPFNWLSVSETQAQRALEELAKHAEQIKKHAASVLNRVANAAKQAGVPCDTIQVENAQPYQAIIATAADRGCDLIVMASHGRSGLSAVVLGSVTNKVLTHTKTPVLVCH